MSEELRTVESENTQLLPQRVKKLLGFRLRSPHLFGEEPCPLSLQTVFSPTALRLSAERSDEVMAFKI